MADASLTIAPDLRDAPDTPDTPDTPEIPTAPAVAAEPWNPYRPYRTTLLGAVRVRELSQLRPHRVVLDTVRCWSLMLAAWTAVAAWTTWWMVALAIPIIGTQYYALFIIGHDGMHRRLFNRLAVNDLFTDCLLLGPIGAITRINNRNHLAHHRHLSTELDPDRHKHGSYNKDTRPKYLVFLSGLATLYPAVKNVFFPQPDPGAGKAPSPAQAARRYRGRDLLILVGWQALLIGGLTAAIGWWAFPLLWLLPCFLFMYLADLFRSFMEHSHPEPDEQADAHRLITYTSNRFERLLFAPMNMNYHTAHHLWPSIPYYNLPRADREIQEHDDLDGLHWRGSYLHYLWTYFLALPLPRPRHRSHTHQSTGRRSTIDFATVSTGVSTVDAVAPASVPAEQGRLAPAWLRTPPPFDTEELPMVAVVPVPECPVCGQREAAEHALGFDYEYRTCRNCWRFMRCIDCGHVRLDPRPAASALPVIYPSDYYAYHYESRINPLAVRAKRWLDRRKMRGVLRAGARRPRTYLDIGCGTGRFLRLMHDWGLPKERLLGIELDPNVVERLQQEGYQALSCRIEACEAIEEQSLDLVTMFHVIEHVEDPGAVVEKVARWLRPGGILAVETPNLDSQDARVFADSFWGGYHIPRHFHLFCPSSLERLCRDRGLRVERVSHQPGHSFWMYSFQHRLRYGATPHPRLARFFDPFQSLPPLALFTLYDTIRARLGCRTSSMLMVLKKR